MAKMWPPLLIVRKCTLATTQIASYSYLFDTPPTSNENVIRYPSNNSIEKWIVKYLRDRKIIIANFLLNSNESHHQRQQSMTKVPCIWKCTKMHTKMDFLRMYLDVSALFPPCVHGVSFCLTAIPLRGHVLDQLPLLLIRARLSYTSLVHSMISRYQKALHTQMESLKLLKRTFEDILKWILEESLIFSDHTQVLPPAASR